MYTATRWHHFGLEELDELLAFRRSRGGPRGRGPSWVVLLFIGRPCGQLKSNDDEIVELGARNDLGSVQLEEELLPGGTA